jgi:glycosyltransferase involved in cell wall biosynthesis
MKISYVTTYDALNIHNWSGTGYHIAKALENQNADIEYIGNLKIMNNSILKLKKIFYNKIFRKDFDIFREPFIAKRFAEQIQSRLNQNTDIIFSPGSIPIALLESRKSKVFYTDATFAGMIGYYSEFSNLSSETIKHGNYLEQIALETSKLIIYSSDWAARTAIDNYKVDPNKIKVVPFGANIECDRNFQDIKNIILSRSTDVCNLLFMGVDWIRKGGDMALQITEELNKSNLKTKLHIVGLDTIPIEHLPEYAINYGFINKSTQEGKAKINELFLKSHFLILPTNAEAYGLVFCEANSFGLPNISTNVGGIPTIIKDNINGKTFSLESDVSEWTNYILNTFRDKKKYTDLCLSSFGEFQNRLNWNVAGKTIMNLLKELL